MMTSQQSEEQPNTWRRLWDGMVETMSVFCCGECEDNTDGRYDAEPLVFGVRLTSCRRRGRRVCDEMGVGAVWKWFRGYDGTERYAGSVLSSARLTSFRNFEYELVQPAETRNSGDQASIISVEQARTATVPERLSNFLSVQGLPSQPTTPARSTHSARDSFLLNFSPLSIGRFRSTP